MVSPSSEIEPRGRVLVTGAAGFTGRYMVGELADAGYTVIGTVHSIGNAASESTLIPCDLCDRSSVFLLVKQIQPDHVVHLAAIPFVAHGNVQEIYQVNLFGTINLLSALADLGKPLWKVILASSANVYGNVDVDIIDETVCPQPANHYAISKLAMEHAARLWFDRLPLVITRPFNYTGVGQAEHFLLPKIVAHFKRREKEIELGNLDVERDFSDVRAIVRIYRQLLESPAVGEIVNICSGRSTSLAEVLRIMAAISGYEIDARVNPTFVRANEVKQLVGSNAKLYNLIGAQKSISFFETLHWMYCKI